MSLKVGLVGCGRISDIYLQNCARFDELDIIACASLDLAESKAKAAQHDIPLAYDVDTLIANPDIDCVLNLTIPAAHAEITKRALHAGKHVYSEKPFVTERQDGLDILQLASEKNLLVGNAPDTFLGGRWQVVRELLDNDVIGEPVAVSAFVGTHGVERHHPNPDFYYQRGGGPLLDLGPYYLTAMVFLFGAVTQVTGMAKRSFERRMIENGPRYGQWMDVEVDTHSQNMFSFENGVMGNMTMSFDIWDSEMPRFEIYGTTGTITITDPDPVHGANVFEGDVLYRTIENSRWTHQPRPADRGEWLIAPNQFGYNYNARGLGLRDLALAIRDGRKPRASAELAFHIFDIMDSLLKSVQSGHSEQVLSRCERPEPMPKITPATQDA